MLRLVVIGAVAVFFLYAVLILLAARLPPGLARDLASFVPDCVTTARRLRKDPRVPRAAKIAVAFAGLWALSPIDLIPEFLPIIGPIDDVVVITLALRFAARRVPPDVIIDAWPGNPAIIKTLLGAVARRPRRL